MTTRRAAIAAIVAAGALVPLGAQDVARWLDRELPVTGIVRGATATWVGCRVVDDLTGAPVPAAELFAVPESQTPLPGTFWSSRRTVGDADGFVRMRTDDVGGWLLLRAEGSGPAMRGEPPEPVWRLARAFDVPVLVRDWLGRPVGGARIGFCGGCGHTPDLVNATTDANGVAVLRVDPHNDIADVYVQHPGVGLGYQEIRWIPGEPPCEVDCGPSPPIRGVLLDDAGRPVAGAFLGTHDVHRGPWTQTDERGRFELLGAESTDSVVAVLPGGRQVCFTNEGAWPATLRLPLPDLDEDGSVVAPVRPAADVRAPVRIAVRWAEGVDGAAFQVTLRVAGRTTAEDVTTIAAAGGSVLVPPGTPFAFWLARDRPGRGTEVRTVGFVDDAAAAAVGPVRLRPFAPTTLRARAVGPDGGPVAVRAAVATWRTSALAGEERSKLLHDAAVAADGRVELTTDEAGTVVLVLEPDGDLLPRNLFVHLPPRGDDVVVDVGDVAFATTPRLRVLAADGEPARGFAAYWKRPGFQEAGTSCRCELRADGAFVGPDLAGGDAVLVRPESADDDDDDGAGPSAVPFRTVLDGDGPWTIRVPEGRLALATRDAAGVPIRATVYVADRAFDCSSTLELTQLPPGPTRLFFAFDDERGVVVDCTVPATGTKRLVLTLTEPAPTLRVDR